MKHVIVLSLSVITILLPACSSCNDPKKEEAVVTAPQNPDSCISSLDPNAESDIDAAQVEFSFVFMGCNRVDTNSLSNASTANVFQLQRTFNEVSGMKIKPKFFFFLGDLVLGLQENNDTLSHQLNAWVKQFQSPEFSDFPGSGIRLVALPGNHEMLYAPKKGVITPNTPAQPRKPELPWQNASAVWRSIMQPFCIQVSDNYGISYAPEDSITYSFNYQDTHFVLLNTDMYDPQKPFTPGLSPAAWTCNDISTAKKTGKINHIFVMGHKPSYILLKSTIRPHEEFEDEIMDRTVTDKIWPVMESNKVEAMLSAHRHEFSALQPEKSKTYQLIAGNGGSKYESNLPINNQFFGYTKIYVMKNGEVIARSFGRLTPKKQYTDTLPCDTLTRVRYNQLITWGTKSPSFEPTDSIQPVLKK